MVGFCYMTVRGVEFPLWFIIIILLVLVVASFFMFKAYKEYKDAFKTPKNIQQESKEEILNYMGKDRLKEILLHYIHSRYGDEMYDDIVSGLKECSQEKFYIKQSRRDKDAFYAYTQTNGFPALNEWLNCICCGHVIFVEVCGEKSKRVTITDLFGESLSLCDHFYTYYDENFVPKPNETELRGDTAQTQTLGFGTVKPFSDKNTVYNSIERDSCVCYNIAK